MRRLRGRWMLAAIRPRGRKTPVWALPKGLIDSGERPEETALREVEEETGVAARLVTKLGDVRYVYTWDGERIFKVVSFYLLRYSRGGSGTSRPSTRSRSRRRAGCRSRRLRSSLRTAASARWRKKRSRSSVSTAYDLATPGSPAMYALNFYSPIVADQLRSRRKTATIRLGDKSKKYKKGMIVRVLVGARYGPREKIFDAVIDKVDVKKLAELSPRDIEHDNPEVRRPEELATFLGQLYNREVSADEIVTLIRFSEIRA